MVKGKSPNPEVDAAAAVAAKMVVAERGLNAVLGAAVRAVERSHFHLLDILASGLEGTQRGVEEVDRLPLHLLGKRKKKGPARIQRDEAQYLQQQKGIQAHWRVPQGAERLRWERSLIVLGPERRPENGYLGLQSPCQSETQH